MIRKMFLICGKQYSGKDTVAKWLQRCLHRDPKGHACNVALATLLKFKYMAKYHLRIEELITNKHLHRKGLQKMGSAFRTLDVDYWCKKLTDSICENIYDEHINKDSNIIVSDMRYLSEVEYFTNFCSKNNYDMRVIKVIATLETRQKRAEKLGQELVGQDHQSETEIEEIEANYNIHNDYHLVELRDAVNFIVETEESGCILKV